MASYLTTATIGEFDPRSYQRDGVRYWDAFDPDLFDKALPRTGERNAISQAAAFDEAAYKRLARTISVPAAGADLSFWIDRDLTHYQTAQPDGSCAPTGIGGGSWWAVSGHSEGYEQWKVDLSAYAGTNVEVSITYASDDLVQLPGVVVDDIVVSTGEIVDASFVRQPEIVGFLADTFGDPSPDDLFAFPVYAHGAMTLHQLRLAVGDQDFFTILKTWASSNRGGNVTTPQFIALSEQISGQQLDSLFQTWLFTTTKPALDTAAAARTATTSQQVPPAARSLLERGGKAMLHR